jgi:hypothetical protein
MIEIHKLSRFSQEDYLTINKPLVRTIGFECAGFLSELIDEFMYYYKNNQAQDGWFYSTTENVQERTGWGRKTQDRLIKKLKDLKLIEYKLAGLPAKRYFKINIEVAENLINQYYQTTLSKSDIRDCPQRTICSVQNGQIYKKPKERNCKERNFNEEEKINKKDFSKNQTFEQNDFGNENEIEETINFQQQQEEVQKDGLEDRGEILTNKQLEFEEIYKIYENKQEIEPKHRNTKGYKDLYKRFKTKSKDFSYNDILQGTLDYKNYLKICFDSSQGKFCPKKNFETFLNQQAWQGEGLKSWQEKTNEEMLKNPKFQNAVKTHCEKQWIAQQLQQDTNETDTLAVQIEEMPF